MFVLQMGDTRQRQAPRDVPDRKATKAGCEQPFRILVTSASHTRGCEDRHAASSCTISASVAPDARFDGSPLRFNSLKGLCAVQRRISGVFAREQVADGSFERADESQRPAATS